MRASRKKMAAMLLAVGTLVGWGNLAHGGNGLHDRATGSQQFRRVYSGEAFRTAAAPTRRPGMILGASVPWSYRSRYRFYRPWYRLPPAHYWWYRPWYAYPPGYWMRRPAWSFGPVPFYPGPGIAFPPGISVVPVPLVAPEGDSHRRVPAAGPERQDSRSHRKGRRPGLRGRSRLDYF